MRRLVALPASLSLVAATVVASAGLQVLAADAAHAGTPRTYYVDTNGSDAAAGTSEATAWRTLSKVTAAALNPGDTVRLKRSQLFVGALKVSRSGTSSAPISIAAYGDGSAPEVSGSCIDVSGSYVVIRSLTVSDCSWAGIAVSGDDVKLTSNRVTHNIAGILVRAGAERTRITGNVVVDNRRMSVNTPGGDDDSGAFGILVRGDYTEIDHNQISGHFASSYDYGTDGSAVEIYGAVGTSVHHNTAKGNYAFTELGDPRTSQTTYAYNAVTSSLPGASFLITRGAGRSWGPIVGTVAEHNSVKLTGTGSQGFVCHSGCSASILSLHYNVIQAVAKVGYADGAFDLGNNVFWGGQLQFQKSSSDVVAAPGFTSTGANDISLTANSPAVDRAAQPVWRTDIRGLTVPVDGDHDGRVFADLGAYEYQ